MLSIAAFDLETSNLNADYGRLLCGVVWAAGASEPKVFRGDTLNKKWKNDREDDSAVVRAVAEELAGHDILIAHNGAAGGFGFDIPFLQSRLACHRMPAFPRKKIIDPVRIARQQFRISGNSLESISAHLGLTPKMKLPPAVWVKASHNGCKESMNLIVERCVSDVRILCEIIQQLKGYVTQIDAKGSWW